MKKKKLQKQKVSRYSKLYSKKDEDVNLTAKLGSANAVGFPLESGKFDIKSLKITNILFLLLIFLLPTQLGKHFFYPFSYIFGIRIDYLAPTLYLTDLLIILLVILNLKKVTAFILKKKILSVLALLCVSTIFAISKEIAVYKFLKIIELLAVFIIFYENKISQKIITWGFLAGGIFQLILVSLQFVYKSSLQGIFYFFGERYLHLGMPDIAKASLKGVEILRPYGTFSHPNSLAGFYLLVYTFFLTSKKIKNSPLKNIILLTSTLLIFLSFSKIALAAFLVINFWYFLKNYSRGSCTICKISKLVVLSMLTFIFFSAQGDPESTTKRLWLMKQSGHLIFQNPFLGVGLGNYLLAAKDISIKNLYLLQPVHNIFLLFVAEAGIFISIVVFYFLSKLIYLNRKVAGIWYLVFVISLTGFFDHYWLTLQQNWILTGAIFGFLLNKRS